MKQEKESQPPPYVHPLLERALRFELVDWPSWCKRFDEASAEELGNLIHIGLQVPYSIKKEALFRADRIALFMNLADGHNRPFDFRGSDEDGKMVYTAFGAKSIESIRLELAQKAYAMLCKNLFALNNNFDTPPDWAATVTQPAILEKLLWFFRVDGLGGESKIRNVPGESRKELRETTRKFLGDFCRFALNYEKVGYREWNGSRDLLPGLKAIRPRLIPIMDGLGILNLLLQEDYAPDEATFNALKKLVMSREIKAPGGTKRMRLPQTPDEALMGGTKAAFVLYTLIGIRKTEVRFEEIRQLEAQQAELAKQQRELGRKLAEK